MRKLKYIIATLAAALIAVIPLSACNSNGTSSPADTLLNDTLLDEGGSTENESNVQGNGDTWLDESNGQSNDDDLKIQGNGDTPKTVQYLTVTAEGVNIRSGAGTGYSVRGQAEKSTLYCLLDAAEGWHKTQYRGKAGYISTKYCTLVYMPSSDNELIERVIEEGCKLLGTPYVYGAVRLHDGNGKMLKNFTTDEFDCSSLMQYIFYKGANTLLQVNTRTQIYQGTTVSRSELERGDLLFFTNAQRKNLKGVERIGHVALYLGDNYILHTASDYAKIEQISSTRWGYFIQAQRIL